MTQTISLEGFRDPGNFHQALRGLFDSLNVPVNQIDDKPLEPGEILSDATFKPEREPFNLMRRVFILGMVDDAAFANPLAPARPVEEIRQLGKDYDGILVFGVELCERPGGLPPNRSQLAEITRAFNREFHYTPVVVVFRYGGLLSLASAERLAYQQQWREGEKVGKVSILRDVDIANPHAGHLKILEELRVPAKGKNAVNSFAALYQYWREVFGVGVLNKKFYSELSNWYFWALRHIKLPEESQFKDDKNTERRAIGVIRLLTRLLFIWFIKEKGLVPEELFDLESLQNDILKKISPFHHEDGLFRGDNLESVYYKAILQNLFFATLNCPIAPDTIDARQRGFRGRESFGKHRGVDYLMRYKQYFQNPAAFLELVNQSVPFLNGGLFECLDDKDNNIFIDGFSDNPPPEISLVVPDFLFFGREEAADLSEDYGVQNQGTRAASVKGLVNILKSYKFTIAENTPVEEDVALDPELLGKVFENLLATYNPETRATARKQTGSFYTPREIVNYMVDESLVAHLKTALAGTAAACSESLEDDLRLLVSYSPANPLAGQAETSAAIIHALDNCKVLDPACGSGAFPMGMLQKMVHVLQKADPDNSRWQEIQMEKAIRETRGVFAVNDKAERDQLLLEINEAFDQTVNNPDYARKLFLVENCVFGVDIQPIATQISKLRFFISLVVEQKVRPDKPNFGIRPLPNLETKFVAANTLVGVEKPAQSADLFDNPKIKELEAELKIVRHKLFGARTKSTKSKYRQRDAELRNAIAAELENNGWGGETAKQLAQWDPYDQNASSPFFDPEWMFGIESGFNIVIGNPPYVRHEQIKAEKAAFKINCPDTFTGTADLYVYFFDKGIQFLRQNGVITYITSNKFFRAAYGAKLREHLASQTTIRQIIDFGDAPVFNAIAYPTIFIASKSASSDDNHIMAMSWEPGPEITDFANVFYQKSFSIPQKSLSPDCWRLESAASADLIDKIRQAGTPLGEYVDGKFYRGILTGLNEAFVIDEQTKDRIISEDANSAEIIKPFLRGRDVKRWTVNFAGQYLIRIESSENKKHPWSGMSEAQAEPAFQKTFPGIYKWLQNFRPQLIERSDQGKYWWELRSCKYWDSFNSAKIVYPDIAQQSEFAFDDNGHFLANTLYIIPTENKFLLGVLNSSAAWYYYGLISNRIRGGFVRFIAQYVETIPIPSAIPEHQNKIESLVDQILAITKASDYPQDQQRQAQVKSLEREINQLVYELYGLTEEEIKIVEGEK